MSPYNYNTVLIQYVYHLFLLALLWNNGDTYSLKTVTNDTREQRSSSITEHRDHTQEGYLLAGVGLHLRKVEANTLVQTVRLMGGGTTLDRVTVCVLIGDISSGARRHP